MKRYLTGLIAASGAIIGLAAEAALADPVADFYKSNPITLIIPFSPGGTTASQAQIAAKYLPQYIPGNPTIRAEFMPGAGGMLAVNQAYNSSPRDGSVIIYAQDSNVVQQLLNPEGVNYDVTKMNWLGSVVEYSYVLGISKESGVSDVDGLKTKELFVASTGTGSASHIFPTLTNAMLGTQMKVVPGYPGGAAEIYLALERGEMQGYVTQYWFSNQNTFKNFNPVLTFASERSKSFPDVPTLLELVKDPEDQQVVKFVGLIGTLGRGFATMPDVPEDRVAALRKAFDDMAANPEFIAEMKKLGTGEEVRRVPLSGVEMQQKIVEGLQISDSVIARARASVGPK